MRKNAMHFICVDIGGLEGFYKVRHIDNMAFCVRQGVCMVCVLVTMVRVCVCVMVVVLVVVHVCVRACVRACVRVRVCD